MTSSSISMFGLDLGSVNKKKSKITELIPDFEQQISEMMEKGGVDIKIEFKNKDFQVDQMFNVQVQEITFRVKNQQPQGYIVKMEKQKDKHNNTTLDDQNNTSVQRVNKLGNVSRMVHQQNNYFHFQFDQNQSSFFGEYTSEANDNLIQPSVIGSVKNNDETFDYLKNQPKPVDNSVIAVAVEEGSEEKKMIDYGIGIRQLRLFNGQVLDLEDFKKEEMEDEEEEEDIIKERQQKIQ